MWICIAPCREHTSKALRYGTHSQGISQFYLHTPRSSANGMNHTYLRFPSRSWYSFTDAGGMEGWVGYPSVYVTQRLPWFSSFSLRRLAHTKPLCNLTAPSAVGSMNDCNGLAVTAVAVMLSLKPGVSKPYCTSVTLTLTRWSSYTNMTRIWRCIPTYQKWSFQVNTLKSQSSTTVPDVLPQPLCTKSTTAVLAMLTKQTLNFTSKTRSNNGNLFDWLQTA